MSAFQKLRSTNVNDKVEKKNGLTYLSWAWAWDAFKQACPEATYEVVKNPQGLPYFEDDSGAMVFTRVTAGGETHEMWLPVMDGANRAMKREPYAIKTARGEQWVQAFTMFDVNKAVMRCLVKNLAMFGLGLYIYAGEDLPDETEEAPAPEKKILSVQIQSPRLDPQAEAPRSPEPSAWETFDYRLPFGKKHKGKTLEEIGPAGVKEAYAFILAKPTKSDDEIEFLSIAHEWLKQFVS